MKITRNVDKRIGSGRVGAATVKPHPGEEPNECRYHRCMAQTNESAAVHRFCSVGTYANCSHRRMAIKGARYTVTAGRQDNIVGYHIEVEHFMALSEMGATL